MRWWSGTDGKRVVAQRWRSARAQRLHASELDARHTRGVITGLSVRYCTSSEGGTSSEVSRAGPHPFPREA